MTLSVGSGESRTIDAGTTAVGAPAYIGGELNLSGTLNVTDTAELSAPGVGSGVGTATLNTELSLSAAGVGEGVGTATLSASTVPLAASGFGTAFGTADLRTGKLFGFIARSGETRTVDAGTKAYGSPAYIGGELNLSGTLNVTDTAELDADGIGEGAGTADLRFESRLPTPAADRDSSVSSVAVPTPDPAPGAESSAVSLVATVPATFSSPATLTGAPTAVVPAAIVRDSPLPTESAIYLLRSVAHVEGQFADEVDRVRAGGDVLRRVVDLIASDFVPARLVVEQRHVDDPVHVLGRLAEVEIYVILETRSDHVPVGWRGFKPHIRERAVDFVPAGVEQRNVQIRRRCFDRRLAHPVDDLFGGVDAKI